MIQSPHTSVGCKMVAFLYNLALWRCSSCPATLLTGVALYKQSVGKSVTHLQFSIKTSMDALTFSERVLESSGSV